MRGSMARRACCDERGIEVVVIEHQRPLGETASYLSNWTHLWPWGIVPASARRGDLADHRPEGGSQ